jgi:hypothetical protein
MISPDQFINYLKAGEIPPEPPEGSSLGGHIWDLDTMLYHCRHEATERGMWAIVDKVWTKKLAAWIGDRTCLEVMAGAGWLAKALSEHGIDIVATDSGDWDDHHPKAQFVYQIEITEGEEAAKKYHDKDILIISWPPYGEDAICHICEQWGSDKPIILISEDDGGCNAPPEFWSKFHIINDQPDIPLMAWTGIHDRVFIGHYRGRQQRRHEREAAEKDEA